MHDTSRPNPEQILEALDLESRLRHRGRLKIFFGGSAGVGKTYAMLQAARVDKADGIDVIIGIVETHGRSETQKMVEGLPELPRKIFSRGNVSIKEFDLDAALARRPELILVDELAHTNATGSRHPKRWQDVEELLDAGIDVYTTLNVQHLEGFNDVIASITGIVVQELVPDVLFDEANEIQLVDVPTEELLDRLHEGKIYIAPGAKERAGQNFFNKTNLMSLRELALRRTAEHVDADTDYQRVQEGLFTPNIAGDRVLVCVGQDTLAPKLVRTTRRIANSLRAPWYALAIEKTDGLKNEVLYNRQQRALSMAEKNGAVKVSVLQEERLGEAILNYARNNGITKIVIGRNIRPAWHDWVFGSLVEYIIRHSGIIDVYIITGHAEKRRWLPQIAMSGIKDYLWAVSILMGSTFFGVMLRGIFQPIDMVMVYLIGVITCAVKFGRLPSFLFAILSVLTLNFFFIEPIHTFTMVDGSYWLSLFVMLVASFIISEQATKLRLQTTLSRMREAQTQTFYALTKELAGAREGQKLIDATLRHLAEAVSMPATFWKLGKDMHLEPIGAEISGDLVKEEMVAVWAFQNGQAAGLGTSTMPSAKGFYFPLIGSNGSFGVLSVEGKKGTVELSVDEKAVIETFARLLTTALDRVTAARGAEQLKIASEAERMKNTFLSSMSHDMRTPLAAIRGSAETLLSAWHELEDKVRSQLLTSIRDETERLSRIVRNLLDLTRFETGRISIKQEPYYLSEIIGAVLKQMQRVLMPFKITIDMPKDLSMVNVDALLVEQLFQNLLENAASFSKAGQAISIKVSGARDFVVIDIFDKGPGIIPGKEQQIFDKFFTMEQEDRPKGAGLGLAICQAIILAHGGTIAARNMDQGGSCFTFTLPLYKNPAGMNGELNGSPD